MNTDTATTFKQPVSVPARRVGRDYREVLLGSMLVATSVLLPDLLGNTYWTHAFQLCAIYIVAVIAQNLLLADAGQASFGQGAVFGIAAYAMAVLTTMHGWSLASAAAAGIVASLGLALLYALPALRVQHFYLGFVTLSAAVILPEMALAFAKYTNGVQGISENFPRLHTRVLGGTVSVLSLLIATLVAAALAAHAALRKSVFGRRIRVAADSTEAAGSLGIHPGQMRFAGFLLAGLATGAAGVLYPAVVGFVAPTSFSLELSMLFFFGVIVGGRGTLLGPIVGVWVLYLLPNMLLAEFVQVRLVAYGLAALLTVMLFPDGIVGTFERWRRRHRDAVKPLDLHVEKAIGGFGRALPAARCDIANGAVMLEVRGARKSFGSVRAVDGVNLRVEQGEIHGLVGANGSGKTSLLNVLSGFSRLDEGSVQVAGVDITRLPAYRIARLGVGRTFQTPRIFKGLSLWENVRVGLDSNPNRRRLADDAALRTLRERLGNGTPEGVPHGQRRLLEVLRIALHQPRVLLLDEPAAGLSPEERKDFARLLRRLRDESGTTIILVEHDLDFVWDIADRITALDTGRVVASGTPAEVAADPAAQHLFVRRPHA